MNDLKEISTSAQDEFNVLRISRSPKYDALVVELGVEDEKEILMGVIRKDRMFLPPITVQCVEHRWMYGFYERIFPVWRSPNLHVVFADVNALYCVPVALMITPGDHNKFFNARKLNSKVFIARNWCQQYKIGK